MTFAPSRSRLVVPCSIFASSLFTSRFLQGDFCEPIFTTSRLLRTAFYEPLQRAAFTTSRFLRAARVRKRLSTPDNEPRASASVSRRGDFQEVIDLAAIPKSQKAQWRWPTLVALRDHLEPAIEKYLLPLIACQEANSHVGGLDADRS